MRGKAIDGSQTTSTISNSYSFPASTLCTSETTVQLVSCPASQTPAIAPGARPSRRPLFLKWKHQRTNEQRLNHPRKEEFRDDEKGTVEGLACSILGELIKAVTVQILLQLQGAKIHLKEWELIRYVLERNKKASTDIRFLALALEGRKLGGWGTSDQALL